MRKAIRSDSFISAAPAAASRAFTRSGNSAIRAAPQSDTPPPRRRLPLCSAALPLGIDDSLLANCAAAHGPKARHQAFWFGRNERLHGVRDAPAGSIPERIPPHEGVVL